MSFWPTKRSGVRFLALWVTPFILALVAVACASRSDGLSKSGGLVKEKPPLFVDGESVSRRSPTGVQAIAVPPSGSVARKV